VAQNLARLAEGVITPGAAANNVVIFVDAIFYKMATSEVWGRNNWWWSFYEAARQLNTLTRPRYIWLIFLYCGVVLVLLFLRAFDPPSALAGALLIAAGLFLWSWRKLHRSIKQYQSEMCSFYHGYRADFVFGHLIQSELIEHQNVSMKLTNVPHS
jgi:hypothetical protein